MDEASLERLVSELPRYMRGPNARRVIRNMANGGARLRTFMRKDTPIWTVTRQLAIVADIFQAKPRTLKNRTAVMLLSRQIATKQAENA